MSQKNIAIVLAAGQGKRMQSEVAKQFLEISGKPVLYYSLKCFQESQSIDEVILVTSEEYIDYCQKEIICKYHFDKVTKVVRGGKERYHSVYEGLKACEECEIVFIHDGARPFISEEIIARAKDAAAEYNACVCAVKVKDTVKLADEQGFVSETPNREQVWTVQTPQVFTYDLIFAAYHQVIVGGMQNLTDDAMVVETMTDCKVMLVEGDYCNIKVTTPEDLKIAEIFAQNLAK